MSDSKNRREIIKRILIDAGIKVTSRNEKTLIKCFEIGLAKGWWVSIEE